jgi:predicted flap endonuclease-1-like 5' DNA nuclease
MTARTIAEVLKTHETVVQAIKEQIGSAAKPKPVKRDYAVKQKEHRLKGLQGRLVGANKDKQALVARIDKEIAVLNQQIKGIEEEIKVDKKQVQDPPAPVGPDRRERPGRSSVHKIRGVGDVMAARLKEHGITEASQVARMNQAKLAEILSISEEHAAKLIVEAKRVR